MSENIALFHLFLTNGNKVGIEKFRKYVDCMIWFESNIQRGILKNNKLHA